MVRKEEIQAVVEREYAPREQKADFPGGAKKESSCLERWIYFAFTGHTMGRLRARPNLSFCAQVDGFRGHFGRFTGLSESCFNTT